ncbi:MULTISPECIES: Crp/Fnr family transcriptional regulator [Microvirga]|uniref:Crp/Fnr family transcriptional regulator n=1 Tax=Microvirga TaxID=186650 RepID=UPI0029056B94|nr:Crp/Fnr family transcriptional regulator [Microvirga sp. HBU67655]
MLSEREPLIRKLESISDLSDDDRSALRVLPMRVVRIDPKQALVREGDRPTQSCLILEGIACRYKFTEAGKRQIFAFHTPGDIPDFQSLYLRTMDHSLGTISACTVGFIQHDDLRALLQAHPGIAHACWRDMLIDAAIFREWMLGIGRRPARVRLAHLLCELVVRLRAAGLETPLTVPLPITQTELADALGLSNVHIHRSLDYLRKNRLIRWSGRACEVLDWAGLQVAGEFDPAYLHLDREKLSPGPWGRGACVLPKPGTGEASGLRPFLTRDRRQDELAVVAPGGEGSLQGAQQAHGQGGIVMVLVQPPDELDLLGHTPLAGGDVDVRLGELFAFIQRPGHGPRYARSPALATVAATGT